MLKPDIPDVQVLIQFLHTPTPSAWLEQAIQQLPLLLLDHAHCERKAAATAINFISKYPEKEELVAVMSPLAREELLHFEKVMMILKEQNIPYGPLQPSAYAQRLHKEVAIHCGTPRLCDQLIVGAIIEARSCERFSALVPLLQDQSLAKFYASLVKSEARHFQDYLRLATLYGKNIETRLQQFIALENELICANDAAFRFHSGIPAECMN
ncbi:tRNA-(ms[2]io[6]A)-hydroxylase [Legionella oakridgensis]|uniref:Hydroxylase for synthesis of 2-methylthio-cis-ribozeatin in tRNA n=2 Tax=Legionella oakridgensis TaxID=29423 RepID=W0BEP1_9GAMM|nr:tRNA-(ms[2]io[6]A)-hydroxylase [Legionella oakridgensis]AHE67102.1 hydroxylase for synthesis of 2-methylthio-cis-ribozeatin in tRNA [Legionella oakridgensis ATCC 33761 = DSM 21215]ETO93281.1 hydroxylase for synthesis of 2-methylthio-cis-ribozeatin in tRNA [Legionella oakridgensis RV-2-2007]KTD44439.1 hydroxylase for synthesis of 2-methylthio-cis-ribozeatin in tRNA [Legionella oakridgensis]STY20192.1 tRNA-(ms(2)io(6)a)-hydrolase(tRNA hydroxylase) [Legionella longbeachae]